MRLRSTTTGGFDTEAFWETRTSSSGPWSVGQSFSGTLRSKSINDVVTSGYRRLLECGELLPYNPVIIVTDEYTKIPATGTAEKRTSPGGVVVYQGKGKWAELFYPPIPIPPSDPSLVDAAMIQAQEKCLDAEFDALTFAAEFGKTAGYVTDRFRQAHKLVRKQAYRAQAISKSLRRLKKRPWDVFAELWLEARFAIRPIILDANGALKAFMSNAKDEYYVFGKGFTSESDTLSSSHTAIDPPGNLTRIGDQQLVYNRRYNAVAVLSFKSGLDSKVRVNFLPTLWEVTPWSFVYDYFGNVGSWMNSIGPTLQGQFVQRGYSITTDSEWYGTRNSLWTSGFGYTVTGSHLQGGRHEHKRKEYIRAPYEGVPLPTLIPRITLPKIVDLLALAVSNRRVISKILNGFK